MTGFRWTVESRAISQTAKRWQTIRSFLILLTGIVLTNLPLMPMKWIVRTWKTAIQPGDLKEQPSI